MSNLFPASTNAAYLGSPIAAYFLTLAALLIIGPGLIHTFLPDGGAGVIAGLDITVHRTLIVGVFAWMGATELAWGCLTLIVSLCYRSLVPLVLLLMLMERIVMALNQWILKPGDGPHHPPGVYATLIAIPVIALMLSFSLTKRS
jgi:hypothetical protein